MRLHCQLPADVMVKVILLSGVFPTDMRYWQGEHRDLRMLLRLSVPTGEHANYSQITNIGSSLFTQFMITLLY